jgi:hypothetical protein
MVKGGQMSNVKKIAQNVAQPIFVKIYREKSSLRIWATSELKKNWPL